MCHVHKHNYEVKNEKICLQNLKRKSKYLHIAYRVRIENNVRKESVINAQIQNYYLVK